MIVISFDAECVNQNTAPDIAGLSRDPRYCVGITGEMSEEAREILEAQHVPVKVGDDVRMAPPLLLWSRLLPGDDEAKTLKKVRQRIPQAREFLHVLESDRVANSPVWVGVENALGWNALTFDQLAKKLTAA